jgi:phosphoglycolate phosphatase-like HAD superfamily hydrolase
LQEARAAGGDRYRIFAEVARRLSPEPRLAAAQARTLIETYSDCCTKGIVAAAERRGARAALDALRRRGLKLYVLSATPDRHLVEVLRRRGLLPWLQGALGSSVTKEQGLLKIMARERVDRHAVLLVGDSADDRHAATTIGVKFALVTAERRIDGHGRFALRDMRPLVPLVDYLNGRRRSHVR